MKFKVLPARSWPPTEGREQAFLGTDNWDDWGKYRTMFTLFVFDSAGKRYDPGSVKIGERGLAPSGTVEPGKRAPDLPGEFEALDERFFSLGQDDNYYEALNQLSEELRTAILTSLNDCAFDPRIFDRAINEDVMAESLLRYVSPSQVRTRFHRLAHGDPVLTQFYFEYTLPTAGTENPPRIDFYVTPLSEPPTNVHVLIGRNGVGKTRALQNLAKALVTDGPDAEKFGTLQYPSASLGSSGTSVSEWSFSGLVIVTFSAFDTFVMPKVTRSGIRAAMVGLPQEIKLRESSAFAVELRTALSAAFLQTLGTCRAEPRRTRLVDAVKTLETDPLFEEANVSSLLEAGDDTWRLSADSLFRQLSSGHAIVLLTLTKLVELVDEKTIVLVDEPEGHLHPPLLSAFVRALSDLLIKRNGVALLATHSPVVLQEVPKSCVWVLRRSASVAKAERLTIETFGENVGTLTREVFGLEVTKSGFHALLKKAISSSGVDYDTAVGQFQGQLGSEARAVLRNLLASRDRNTSPPHA